LADRISAPIRTLDDGARLDFLHSLPNVGTGVVIYARGRFRAARVVKVTPTRALVAFGTPSNPTQVKRQYRRVERRYHAEGWFDLLFMESPSGSYQVKADALHARYGHRLINYATNQPVY
jgi:hypothetical protein